MDAIVYIPHGGLESFPMARPSRQPTDTAEPALAKRFWLPTVSVTAGPAELQPPVSLPGAGKQEFAISGSTTPGAPAPRYWSPSTCTPGSPCRSLDTVKSQ
jgi:hypothetical protein